jgi:hypothetical protein
LGQLKAVRGEKENSTKIPLFEIIFENHTNHNQKQQEIEEKTAKSAQQATRQELID